MIEFAESWRREYPGAAVGLLAVTGVANGPPGPALERELAATEARIRARHAGLAREDLQGLSALRPYIEHYRRFGKTYHILLQVESVAWKGRGLKAPASLLAAMFAAEVESLLLTAGHDLNATQTPLEAAVSEAGQTYTGIGGRALEVKPGDLCIRDVNGILSTVLYGPDERTRLTPETTAALFTVYAPAGIEDAAVERHLRRIEELVRLDSPDARKEALEVRRPAGPSPAPPG